MQIYVVSRDTYRPYMKVKIFNVNIVNRNTQKEVVSRHMNTEFNFSSSGFDPTSAIWMI